MDVYVKSGAAQAAKFPSAVQSLHVGQADLEANSVTLAWRDIEFEEDDSVAVEIMYYLIYRSDVGLLATAAGTPFTDLLASTNTTYTYEVSAVSSHCVEGPKVSVTVTTPPGGMEIDKPDAYSDECEGNLPVLQRDIAAGSFDESIELFAGTNYITILINDTAGNELIISNVTYPPESAKEIAKRFLTAPTLPGFLVKNGAEAKRFPSAQVLTRSNRYSVVY